MKYRFGQTTTNESGLASILFAKHGACTLTIDSEHVSVRLPDGDVVEYQATYWPQDRMTTVAAVPFPRRRAA